MGNVGVNKPVVVEHFHVRLHGHQWRALYVRMLVLVEGESVHGREWLQGLVT